jgi:adenylate cyclase
MASDSGQLSRQELELEVDAMSERWEIASAHLCTAIAVVAGFAITATWDSLGSALAGPCLVVTAIGGIYYALYAHLLRIGWVQQRPWTRWGHATYEGLMGSIALLIIYKVKGAEWALTSPTVLIYPVFIALSAVRFRPLLCLYVGGVSVIGYLGLYALVFRPALPVDVLPTAAGWSVFHRVLWLGTVTAVIGLTTWRMQRIAFDIRDSNWKREVLQRELSRYVSRGVAERIMSGDPEHGQPERRDVSVLFCDLRDFTSLCESAPPEEVVELLNTFYERACAVVEKHGGTVNKFMGDGLLALFGAPHDLPCRESAAAEAAHEIMYAADELKSRGGIWRNLEIGIGLDAGDVVVGELGAQSRAEYTAIGSTVNRAARLQGLSREARRRIVLSEEFVRRLGPRANVVGMGKVKLKGLGPVPVYAFRYS